MDRAFSSGASGTPPSAPGSPSTGYATSGNPGTATPATKPGAYWYHMVTEELRALIVAAGLTPDHTNTSQISQAVQAMIAAGASNDYKASVRAATTATIASLAGGAPNTLDGVTLVANDRILVKDQTTGSENGIYVVTTLGTGANGAWTRATDADGVGELTSGAIVSVEEGTTLADSQWMLTTDGAITIGTTALTWGRKDAGAATGVATGAIMDFPATAAPSGFIKLNGALLSRTAYAALWAYAQASGNLAASDGAWVEGQFSPGDGATTFRIPDLRGNFRRSWDDSRGVDSGRAIGSFQADDLKSHTHSISAWSTGAGSVTPTAASSNTPNTVYNVASTGGTETRPRNVAILTCIKY